VRTNLERGGWRPVELITCLPGAGFLLAESQAILNLADAA